MNAHVRWLAALALAALFGCNSDSDSTAFKGPVKYGFEECSTYMAWPSSAPTSAACTDCLHDQCAPAWQTLSQVCGVDPSKLCKGDGGTALPVSNFCTCMTDPKQPCGRAAGNVYACFVNECAKPCAGDAGAGGSSGAGGKGGSAGKGGTGGVVVDSGWHDGI